MLDMKYEYTKVGEDGRQYEEADLLKSDMVEAKYIKSPISFDNGNPFIEALPRPRESRKEIIDAYNRTIPNLSVEEKKSMPLYYKLSDIYLLRQLRFPLPFHKELEEQTYMALVNSYRNRYVKSGKNMEREESEKYNENVRVLGKEGAATNAGFSLLGYSGCGKSSALDILFSNYPQVIVHNNGTTSRFIQIVYLTVNCVANSNFSALYNAIGSAIDKALGYQEPFYEKTVDRARNLGLKADRVRELVERFGIGIIVFDEIQLIDFSSTRENSFEGLMTLANKTKVAVAVVGTEDAYEMMFNAKLRTGRRLGATIIGHQYCKNYEYFKFMVHQLFQYQWFDVPVNPDDELVNALYDNSKGIIDQLIGIYIFMQIDYINASKKPMVNAAYVNKVVERHYPGLRSLLDRLNDPVAEEERIRLVREGQGKIDSLIETEKQKMNSKEILEYMEDEKTKEFEKNKNRLIQEMVDYMDGYSLGTITSAVTKEMNLKGNKEATLSELRKKVMKRLMKMEEVKEEEKGLDQIHIEMRKEIINT